MSFPLSQKAVVLESCGRPHQLRIKADYRIPILDPGELLIKNTLCGVNTVDTYYRNGFYDTPLPAVLGHEAVGTVAALGPGTSSCNFKIGDRVIWTHKRGYAEYSAVPMTNIIKVPRGVSDEDALGGFLSGLTALTLLKEACVVKKGECVLLHAATTNVGLLMIQILKSTGATVIATVDHADKISHVKSLGAAIVLNYKDKKPLSWDKVVKEATKDVGVSVAVVYDCIGKDTWRGSLDVVKTNGTVVWCGSLSGPVPAIRPAWVKYLIMLPFTLFHNPKAKFLLAVGRYLFFLLTITISDTYYQSALRSFMHHQRPIYRVETD